MLSKKWNDKKSIDVTDFRQVREQRQDLGRVEELPTAALLQRIGRARQVEYARGHAGSSANDVR